MHSSKFLSIVLAGRTIPNRLCCHKKIELDKNFDDEPWKQIGRSSPAVRVSKPATQSIVCLGPAK
jgi:hypothetical protein